MDRIGKWGIGLKWIVGENKKAADAAGWKVLKKHETGFEPATLALARRYSTTEPLVQNVLYP